MPAPDDDELDGRKCLDGTRKLILADIQTWLDACNREETKTSRVMWLSGPAGTGKSSIALRTWRFFLLLGHYLTSALRSKISKNSQNVIPMPCPRTYEEPRALRGREKCPD